MDYTEKQETVAREVRGFPEEFGLRAFPGQRFTINRSASYWSGGVMLYVYTAGGEAFCKGRPCELAREVTA